MVSFADIHCHIPKAGQDPPEVSAGSRRSSLQYFRSGKPVFCLAVRSISHALLSSFFRFHRGKRALLRQRMAAFFRRSPVPSSTTAAIPSTQPTAISGRFPPNTARRSAFFYHHLPSVGRNNGTLQARKSFSLTVKTLVILNIYNKLYLLCRKVSTIIMYFCDCLSRIFSFTCFFCCSFTIFALP